MTEQVWFVTGASRGLGYAVAEEALRNGHRVVATARSVERLRPLADRYGEAVLTVELDVTSGGQAERAVTAAVQRFGRVDVLVNNAGYADIAPIEHVDMDSFRAQMETVFFGTVLVTKAALPQMRRQGGGHVIQIVSVGGRITAPGMAAYQSAKFAVEGFSGVLRQEAGPLGVKVTLAEPGGIRTDWAGPSMKVQEDLDPAYGPTVGALAKRTRARSGREPIDPVRLARVLLHVAEQDEPPFHLVLGKDALGYATAALEQTAAEDRRWAYLARSVDFDSEPERP